jgi:Flp pilus assembly pilin Flp
MRDTILKLYKTLQNLTHGQKGQDLVEYALLCSLIALTCIAGIQPIASSIKSVFETLSTSLA